MIWSMGLLDRQFLAGELLPAQFEDRPFRFLPTGENRAEAAGEGARRRIVVRQGPGALLAIANQHMLTVLRLHAEQVQYPLQIAAMPAIDVCLELAREVEAAWIDAKGHGEPDAACSGGILGPAPMPSIANDSCWSRNRPIVVPPQPHSPISLRPAQHRSGEINHVPPPRRTQAQ